MDPTTKPITWDMIRRWVGILTPSLTLIAMIVGFIFNTGERITTWERNMSDERRMMNQQQLDQDKRITRLEDAVRVTGPVIQTMGRDISALRQGQDDSNKIEGLILRALVTDKRGRP